MFPLPAREAQEIAAQAVKNRLKMVTETIRYGIETAAQQGRFWYDARREITELSASEKLELEQDLKEAGYLLRSDLKIFWAGRKKVLTGT